MHDGHRLAVVGDRVFDRGAHQALGTFDGNRLDTDTRGIRETDLGDAHFLLQEIDHFFAGISTMRPLDAGVDVFGVLAEDHHVAQFRPLQRAWHTLEVLHWTHALVEIKFLT